MAVFGDRSIMSGGWHIDDIRVVGYSENTDDNFPVAVAPGANKRILLVAYAFIAEGNMGFKFEDNDTVFTGVMDMAANVPYVVDSGKEGICAAGVNQPLKIIHQGAVQMSGHMRYAIQRRVA